MSITFLQAGNGDCIHIESEGHHVIIDSGEVCQELVSLVEAIQKAHERIDLLVITHYDSDHIKAIINILEGMKARDRKKLVKKVWFNATKIGYHGNDKQLSANDATKLSQILLEAKIKWVSELKKGDKEIINENVSIEVIYGGEIYKPTGEGEYLCDESIDWDTSFNELERYLDDDAIDTSRTNAQSAILVAHLNGKSVLLPGDATPPKLTKALDDYGKDGNPQFDLVKLPHHGSYMNITQKILEKFECSDYMITTNGAKYYHPNKKMMLKVLSWGRRKGKKLKFHLNYYDELFEQLNISQADKNCYKFECDGKRKFEF